jgi:hypothetical protein
VTPEISEAVSQLRLAIAILAAFLFAQHLILIRMQGRIRDLTEQVRELSRRRTL